jgi:hypothetical protein
MRKRLFVTSIVVFLCMLLSAVQLVSADVTTLINLLTGSLGVSDKQAKGGAGAIFDLVRQKVSSDDFRTVANALPGVDSLLDFAPKSSELGSSIGGLSSSFGGKSQSMGSMAGLADSLADSFNKLGLDASMVDKYTNVILDFAKSEAGQSVMNILKGALI